MKGFKTQQLGKRDHYAPRKQRRDRLCGAVNVNKRQNKRQTRFLGKKRTRKQRVCELFIYAANGT